MKWKKLGLLDQITQTLSWASTGTLTPTPILLNPETIRVYFGGRNTKGICRIGYVDLAADDPKKVIRINPEPVIELGEPGMFDDNGMILGDVIFYENQIRLYYIGFQLVEKVKFLAFTGLAISHDHGETFTRYQKTPILDRSEEGKYIRAIHTVKPVEHGFKIWYAVCNDWLFLDHKPFPSYHICYMESKDGIHFPDSGKAIVTCVDKEYRIGRPRVYWMNDQYHMFYTKGCTERSYLPGYASSIDGVQWTRHDKRTGIALSASGWDSKTLCYPSLLRVKEKTYMFYNGNNFGEAGFGCAILEGSL